MGAEVKSVRQEGLANAPGKTLTVVTANYAPVANQARMALCLVTT